MTDKEKIDYEIKVKADARDKEIADWGCAIVLAVVFAFIVLCILSAITQTQTQTQ